jgi:hypothetical protein
MEKRRNGGSRLCASAGDIFPAAIFRNQRNQRNQRKSEEIEERRKQVMCERR